MGDALNEHLTHEEQAGVKNDLAHLRSDWKQLQESVTTLGETLDAKLQQFAEFTCLQEKLTRWLREIEYAMQVCSRLFLLFTLLTTDKVLKEFMYMISFQMQTRTTCVYGKNSLSEQT